jgi:hypothetical protein
MFDANQFATASGYAEFHTNIGAVLAWFGGMCARLRWELFAMSWLSKQVPLSLEQYCGSECYSICRSIYL